MLQVLFFSPFISTSTLGELVTNSSFLFFMMIFTYSWVSLSVWSSLKSCLWAKRYPRKKENMTQKIETMSFFSFIPVGDRLLKYFSSDAELSSLKLILEQEW